MAQRIDDGGDDGFLSRWSRRKVQSQRGLPPPAEAPVATEASPATKPASPSGEAGTVASAPQALAPTAPGALPQAPPAEPAPPTLEDVARLSRDSDYAPFVRRSVAPDVKNAALKKLFSDPHFNIMDGLDTYIDDYGKPDPLPAGMLRKMVGSQLLGLFDHEKQTAPETGTEPAATEAPAAADATPETEPHEDPDLRLQPDDDAGRAGAEPRPAEDPGRQR